MKYVMAIIVIVPGIALAGMLLDQPLKDPDAAYATLVNMLLPPGLRGLIPMRPVRIPDEHRRLHF